MIYQNKDKSYGYAEAPAGSGAESKPYDAKIPKGAHVVGDWHTHGDYSTADKNGKPVRTSDPSKDQFHSYDF
jgi:hypothetical protein